MADSGLLTQGMTVEQAQLLDQRLRKERDAPFRQPQGNYGGGALGGLLSASGQAINSAALAGRNIGEAAGDAYTGREGRGSENVDRVTTEQAAVAQALQEGEGKTYSERLDNAAEALAKSSSASAQQKAMLLRQQAEEARLQEQALQVSKDTLIVKQATEDARKLEAQNASSKQAAANNLKQKQIDASTTKQTMIVDANGIRFNMITKEGGDAPTFVALNGEKDLTPTGQVKTIQEVISDGVTTRGLNAQFNGQFVKDKSATVKQFGSTKKVFKDASDAYSLLKEAQSAGGKIGGVVANFEREAKRYLGISDDKATPIDLLKKKLMLSIAGTLKETFGGSQITDSERTFLVANMVSIDDTPAVMERKLKASMEVSSRGLEKLKALSGAKNYMEFTELQNKYIEQDYLDVQDKFELQFGSPSNSGSAEKAQPINSPNAALIQQATAALARKKAEANARNTSSLNNPNIATSY